MHAVIVYICASGIRLSDTVRVLSLNEPRVGGARGVSNYSAGYCRVASSETVHCEGSSGTHPPAHYRMNSF